METGTNSPLEHDPSKNLGGWTVGHRHYCVHCRRLGKAALDGYTGHPYGRGYDAYRHECPVCLQFWFSNDWEGEPVLRRRDPKFVLVKDPGSSIIVGARGVPIWMLPPKRRRI